MEPTTWFIGQSLAFLVVIPLGIRVSRAEPRVWKAVAICAVVTMLLWPLLRLAPTLGLSLLGARALSFIEVTGISAPAALLFAIAARHVKTATERKAVLLLLPVCALYLAGKGRWMWEGPVPDLGTTKWSGDVCLQSTGYTCVAASLATMLHAHGIDATETEMARLSFTEVGGGTTDSRAVYALQRKLADDRLRIRYESMDYDALCAAPKPCMVQIKWSYFFTHMVPVMSADKSKVVLGDPMGGRRVLRRSTFQDEWSGRGIYLERASPGDGKPSRMANAEER